ncbi:MAG: DUF4034 domain-containing protein [Methylophaga sp.]|nr:DUF4034 domain-containing protein [Methylophaga sp.]
MIKQAISIFILLLFLLFGSSGYADTFEQRALLLSHQFSVLEKNLATANDDYLDNHISIHDYFAVTRTFWFERDIADPALFDALSKWLEIEPKSAYAHVLMGLYWSGKAHQARGKRFAKDTSSEQFTTMEQHFVKAWDYLQKGLKIEPSILEAYLEQLSITRTSSHYGSSQDFMRNVPATMKHNAYIWDIYLQVSIPRWGGSYAQMKQIIDQEIPIYLPKLTDNQQQYLNDIISNDKVDTLIRNDKYKAALALAEKSISRGTDYAGIYVRAAVAAHKLKDVRKCLDYSLKATRLRPWKAKSWSKRGQCAIDRQLWQQANKAYRYKVYIDGITKYGLFKLGQTYMYLSQFDKAYAVFKKAVELDPEYTKYTDMYTSYIEKEKPDQMQLEGKDIYLIIGELKRP